jgi:hypothetical protein
MRTAAIAVFCVTLAGCATLMNGSTQQVALDTVPTGAICDVGGTKIRTPGVITLSRGEKDFYDVACSIDGYKTAKGRYTSHFDDVGNFVFGNILMGGVIPGMIVDAQGGAFALKPATLILKMEPIEKP